MCLSQRPHFFLIVGRLILVYKSLIDELDKMKYHLPNTHCSPHQRQQLRQKSQRS